MSEWQSDEISIEMDMEDVEMDTTSAVGIDDTTEMDATTTTEDTIVAMDMATVCGRVIDQQVLL